MSRLFSYFSKLKLKSYQKHYFNLNIIGECSSLESKKKISSLHINNTNFVNKVNAFINDGKYISNSKRTLPRYYSSPSPLHDVSENSDKICPASMTYLYVPRHKANDIFEAVQAHMDYDPVFENIDLLFDNLKLRGIDVSKNYLHFLKSKWIEFKSIQNEMNPLVIDMKRVDAQRKRLKQKKSSFKDQKERSLIINGINIYEATVDQLNVLFYEQLRPKIKRCADRLVYLETEIVPELLAIPNILSDETPLYHNVTEYVSEGISSRLNSNSKPHHELKSLDSNENLFQFSAADRNNIFFNHDLALAETVLEDHIGVKLEKLGFLRQANPDFARAVCVEASSSLSTPKSSTDLSADCGSLSVNNGQFPPPSVSFGVTEKTSPLMLVGGASISSFLGYYARATIRDVNKFLPQNLYTVGRLYENIPSNSNDGSLDKDSDISVSERSESVFTSMQKSSISCFILDHKERLNFETETVRNLLSVLKNIYDDIGIHYRIIKLSPRNLGRHEKMAYSVQMKTCSNLSIVDCTEKSDAKTDFPYIEVGRISVCGDYISKRLLITYSRENYGKDSSDDLESLDENVESRLKKHDFLQCVFCELLNINKVLAAVTEDLQDKSGLCNMKEFMKRFSDIS